MVAQGDRVVARLAPTGAADGAILGIPLAGKERWPRIEMVRVLEGRVVERWGDPAGYGPSATVFSEALTFAAPDESVPVLQRLAYAPGAADQAPAQCGPAVLSVESGRLNLTVDVGDASGSPSNGWPTAVGPGDAVVVPDGAGFAVANWTDAPAVALLFTLVWPARNPGGADRAGAEPAPAGIERWVLSGYTAAVDGGDGVAVGLARVTLAPGGRLAEHRVGGEELVVVEAGTLTAAAQGFPVIARKWDSAGRSTSAGLSARLGAGAGFAVAGDDATAVYRNEGGSPVTLLLLTIAPR